MWTHNMLIIIFAAERIKGHFPNNALATIIFQIGPILCCIPNLLRNWWISSNYLQMSDGGQALKSLATV